MKKFITTGLIAAVSALSFNTAQAQTPFGCDGSFFVSYSGNGNTDLDSLYFTGNTLNRTVYNSNPNVTFNAIGINPLDGFMYAMQSNNNLLKIGRGNTAGAVTSLGAVASFTNGPSYAGCFDADGTYYFTNYSGSTRLYNMASNRLVNGNGANARTPNGSVQLNTNGTNSSIGTFLVDIAIDPTTGQMYGRGDNGRLYVINKSTGACTLLPNVSSNIDVYGLFFGENGTLYGYGTSGNSGVLYSINKTTAVLTQVGTGVSYSQADGCSCSFRVSHDLAAPTGVCSAGAYDFTMSVNNSSGAVRTGVSYTLELDKRFRYNRTVAQFNALFASAGLGTVSSTITSVNGGTNNKLVVTGISIPFSYPNSTANVTLPVLFMGSATAAPAAMQSVLSGLPSGLGSTDLSNNPNTGTPDDATAISICVSTSLPVTLEYFKGQLNNNNSRLTWEASEEKNFSHYEVERSADGKEYAKIAVVEKQGINKVYQLQDNVSEINSVNVFYRLKAVDTDGTHEYSNVVKLTKELLSDLNVYPNPFNSNLQISVVAGEDQDVEIVLSAMDGRVMTQRIEAAAKGSNNFTLGGLQDVAKGMYLITVKAGNEQKVFKLIK
jgi:hypothetical protein